jgi:hypothetical protein
MTSYSLDMIVVKVGTGRTDGQTDMTLSSDTLS